MMIMIGIVMIVILHFIPFTMYTCNFHLQENLNRGEKKKICGVTLMSVGDISIRVPEWHCGVNEREFKVPTNWLRCDTHRSITVFDRRLAACFL